MAFVVGVSRRWDFAATELDDGSGVEGRTCVREEDMAALEIMTSVYESRERLGSTPCCA